MINNYKKNQPLESIKVDNNKVSKAYVSKIINSIEKELNEYEDKLKINYKNNKIRELIKDIREDIKIKIEELL